MNNNEYVEGLLMRYADGELSDKERAEIETLLEANPALREEMEAMAEVRVTPPVTTMPNKESLLHRTVVPLWWRVAAAVVVLVTAGLFVILPTRNEPVLVARQVVPTQAEQCPTVMQEVEHSGSAQTPPATPHRRTVEENSRRETETVAQAEMLSPNPMDVLEDGETVAPVSIAESSPKRSALEVQDIIVIETDRLAVAPTSTIVTEGYVIDAQLTSTPMQTVVRNLLATK